MSFNSSETRLILRLQNVLMAYSSVQPYTGPVPVFTPSPPRSLNRKTDLRLKMYRDGDKSRAQSEAPKLEDSWTDFSSMVSTAVDNQGQQEVRHLLCLHHLQSLANHIVS